MTVDLPANRAAIVSNPASYGPDGHLTSNAAAAMEHLRTLGTALGIAATAYDIGKTLADVLPHYEAGDMQYVDQELGALVGRIIGGWGGAIVGAELGAELGVWAGPWGELAGALLLGALYGALGVDIGDRLGRDIGGLAGHIQDLLKEYGAHPTHLVSDLFDFLWVRHDPLVLDLNADGVQLTSLNGSNAHFDFGADGIAERTGWASASDGLLVLDINGNGRIDDGTELFGVPEQTSSSTGTLSMGGSGGGGGAVIVFTPPSDTAVKTGFSVLAAFDSNHDGRIDAADPIYDQLRIWKDANQDGVSQPDELTTLAHNGVISIDLAATPSRSEWAGNSILATSGFELAAAGTAGIAAVSFNTDQVNTVFELPDGFKFDPEVFSLPDLRGYGRVPDLWVAMSLDPTLKQMVKDLVDQAKSSFSSIQDLVGAPGPVMSEYWSNLWAYGTTAFEHMLTRWVHVGPSFSDALPGSIFGVADEVTLIAEDFTGRLLPNAVGSQHFYEAFQKFSGDLATRFFMQVPSLDEQSFAYRVTSALSNATPADGVAFTTAELETLLDPILNPPAAPALPPALQAFTSLHYDFVNDSIVGDVDGFLDTQLQSYNFQPDHPWRGFDAWLADHALVLNAVDPDGSHFAERHRAYTGNHDLPVLQFRHHELVGGAGNDVIVENSTDPAGGSVAYGGGGGGSAIIVGLETTPDVGDLLIGNGGDDVLQGSRRPDTYLFSDGSGHDTISDAGGSDEIAFQGNLTSALAHYSFANGNRQDLLISFAGRDETVTVLGYFDANGGASIEHVTFPDGPDMSGRLIRDGIYADLATQGDDVLKGFTLATTLVGLGGNDVLTGRQSGDMLIGGRGNDILLGGGGDDTYVFSPGDGQDIVREMGSAFDGWRGMDTVQLNGYSPGDVTVTEVDGGNSLLLTFSGSTDSIKLENDVNNADYRIERVAFADGTVWSHADVLAQATAPTDGADTFWGGYDGETIAGGAGNDIIDARGGDDVLIGGTGNDILSGSGGADDYLFARGDGQDIIRETADAFSGWGGFDTIDFDEGILPSDIAVTETPDGGGLILSIIGTTDSITLDRDMINSDYRIERIRFADDTIWSHSDLVAMATAPTAGDDHFWGSYDGETLGGGAGNDIIDARGGNDVLTGGTGNDILSGSGGDDTYIFARDDGQDTVSEFASVWSGWGGTDTIAFAAGIAPSDVIVTETTDGTGLVLGIAGSTDTITLDQDMVNADDRVERVTFADGTVWTHADLVTKATTPTAGDDHFFGSYDGETLYGEAGDDTIDAGHGNDILIGGMGDDILSGSGGDDVYRFARGDGNDTVRDFTSLGSGWGGNDAIEFGAEIAPSDVTVTQANGARDVVLTLNNGGGSITLADTLVNGDDRIEEVRFADGTIWTANSLVGRSLGATDGNDTIAGDNQANTIGGLAGDDTIDGRLGDDVLVGNAGDDNLSGGGGNDIYVFARGDGNDNVQDFVSVSSGWGGNDTIQFLVGIDPSDVAVSEIDGGSDLLLTVNNGGGSIRLNDTMVNGDQRIERVTFSDGTVWTHADLVAKATASTGGDDNIWGSYDGESISGGAGNDVIDGLGGDDTLGGGLGNDILYGSGGNDTYLFGIGDGSDAVRDFISAGSGWGGYDRVQLGAGIAPADVAVTLTDDGGSYMLYVGQGTDNLKLLGAAGWGSDYAIEEVRFDDGTVWTQSDLAAKAKLASDHADLMYGTPGDDTFEGLKGDDVFRSGAGSDTYLYRSGDGSDYIDEESGSTSETDILRLVDLNPADVTLIRSGVHSLIKVNSTGDIITFDEQFFSSAYWGIEQLVFADGEVWDRARIQTESRITGTSAADTISGTSGNDSFDGGRGDDLFRSGAGSDTYYYRSGDGSDYIDEESGSTADTDILRLLDLNPSDVTLSKSGVHSLIKVNSTGDVITLDEQFFNSAYWGIEQIVFADGEVWDRSRIQLESTIRGTPGAETLYGTSGDDTFDGGTGDDLFRSGGGSDTYIFRAGDGNDYIDDESGSTTNIDVLRLVDVNSGDVTLTKSGVHALLRIDPTGEVITLDDQFYSSTANWGLEQIVFANGEIWDRARIQSEIWTVGGADADHLIGTAGNDSLDGGTGDDGAQGLGGNDRLRGGAGNDNLDGGNGDDVLVGGAGADTLTGGGEIDTFIFRDGDTGAGDAADRITDFLSGVDRIDLSGIDADAATAGRQAFSFVGGSAFSGSAGELHAIWNGTDTAIEGDTNGDGLADFQILLTGQVAPMASDFVL